MNALIATRNAKTQNDVALNTAIQPSILRHVAKNPNDTVVVGVDEVGRGCLFGHMTVAACILPPAYTKPIGDASLAGTPLAKINDSKKLSARARDALADCIAQTASYAIVDVCAKTIDALNVHQATLLGMRLAIEALIDAHRLLPHRLCVLVDGIATPTLCPQYRAHQSALCALKKGDGLHVSVACASVLAKTSRDRAMLDYHRLYPFFGFDKHKGYPTAAHKRALDRFGVLPEHRKSYKPIADRLQKTP